MGVKAGSKQRFTPTLTTTSQVIGYIKNTLGAKAIVVRVYNAVNSNVVTCTANPSYDGGTALQAGPTFSISPSAGGPCDVAGTLFVIAIPTTIPGALCFVPFVELSLTMATAGSPVTVDCWPVHDQFSVDIPLGQGLP